LFESVIGPENHSPDFQRPAKTSGPLYRSNGFRRDVRLAAFAALSLSRPGPQVSRIPLPGQLRRL